jgi:hypothetical protein
MEISIAMMNVGETSVSLHVWERTSAEVNVP